MIKRTIVFLLFFGLLFSCSPKKGDETTTKKPRYELPSSYLVPYYESGKAGFKNTEGEVIIPARFFHTTGFDGSPIAPVVDDDGWAYINTQGDILFRPFVYDNGPDYFSEGLARFVEKGKIGFHNNGGDRIIEPQFDFATPFAEGLAAACQGCKKISHGEHESMEGGQWGYIDKEGKTVIPFQYDRARPFQDGFAKVRIGKDFFLIDRDGKKVEE